MQLSNYLLNLIKKDRKIDRSLNICIYGIEPILRTINKDIKKEIPHCCIFLIRKLKSPRSTISCWIGGWNPIPIKKVYKLLKIWKETCHKSKKDFEDKWEEIFQKSEEFGIGRGKSRAKLPKRLTRDLAYIMGFVLADGYLKDQDKLIKRGKWREYSVVMYDNSEDFLVYIQRLMENLFGVRCNLYFAKDKKGSWYVLRCTSKPVFRFFSEVLGMPQGNKTGNVGVPRLIKKSDQNLQRAFIAGFCDGEGGIGISTKNPWLEIAQNSILNKPPPILIWVHKKLKKMGIHLSSPSLMSKSKNWRIRTGSKKIIDLYYQEVPIRHIDKINACKRVGEFSYG